MRTLSHLRLAVQNLEILDELKAKNFQTEVGPGVYDIHSPRVPQDGEIDHTIEAILAKVPSGKVWINPDCGLKTRGIKETKESLIKLVNAAKEARDTCKNCFEDLLSSCRGFSNRSLILEIVAQSS